MDDVYVSLEKVIDTIHHRVCQGNGHKENICKHGSCAYCGIMEIMSDISSIPAADVQPVKHGRWLYNTHTEVFPWKCSKCNYDTVARFNFCPNCGSYNRMDGDSE